MKTKFLILSLLSLNISLYSQVLLYDDFNGTSVNSSLWNVTLPYSDSSVTEGGGYVALENAGTMVTKMSMPTSYEIYGSFLMANNQFSPFFVLLRNNGLGYGGSGVGFELNIQDDPAGGGSTTDNLKVFTVGNPAGDSYLTPDATANLTLNTWHTFLITDNGYNLDLYFDGSATPNLSAETTFSAGHLVTLFNRQGAASGSSISANGITELDYLQINQVPEPSTLAIIGLGLLPFVVIRKFKMRSN